MTDEAIEIESSIARVKKTSKKISAICNIVSVALVFTWLALTLVLLYQLFTSGGEIELLTTVYSIASLTAFFGWLLLFVRVVASIFSDINNGGLPFSKKSIKRVRVLAYLLIAFVLLEFLLSASSTILLQHANINIQFVHTTDLAGQVVKINVGALFMAAVLYSLSVVFEHGKLLQRLSDETG